MSAMTALAANERDQRGDVDLGDALRQGGSAVQADCEALWRRLVFNLLVSNTDDHLRNHGFLHDGRASRLAPAYDVNPMPADVRPRVHALALAGDDPAAPFDAVLEDAPRFGLTTKKARRLAREVATAVKGWWKAAASVGLGAREVERMESAFEHDDLSAALR
jgi:serine/threonine-protein kinase HipA